MKSQRILMSVFVSLVFLLIAVVGWTYAQGPATFSSRASQTALGSSFTYQGELKIGGEPVNETCNVAFRLYDTANEGSQVGVPITRSVVISNGLFTQILDFGAEAFTGDARWLDIRVMCAGLGDTAFTPLGRQELTAAPYAHYAASTGALHGLPVATTAPSEGQVLEWDGATWGPALDDGTTVLAGAGLSSDSNGAAVTLTVAFNGTGTADTVARSDHTHTGDQITTAVSTATHALQADIAADVEAGAIMPIHLNEITGNGADGQVLASDGSGGFTWRAAPAVRQLVQDFVVASGESISAGDVVAFIDGAICRPGDGWGTESVFNAAGAGNIAVASLSSTGFVVAYADGGNANHGTAIVGTVSGGSLSWGTPAVFNAAGTGYIAVTSLSPTSIVVAYADGDNSSYGTAIVGTVSGTNLSWGSESVFNAASTEYIASASLSPTAFVVAYSDGGYGNEGAAIAGTVSGQNVTWGIARGFYHTTRDLAVSALSSTRFVVAYRNQDNAGYGTAVVGTISGTLSGAYPVWGIPSVFHADDTGDVAVTSLSPTRFVVAYRNLVEMVNGMTIDWGGAIVGTVSEEAINWGAESIFGARNRLSGLFSVGVISLSPTDVAVTYVDTTDFNDYGMAILGRVDGDDLVWGSASVFNAESTYEPTIVALSPTDWVVAYGDGFSGAGTAIVGHHHWQVIGTAASSASGGETVAVIVGGVSDAHSGLVPGATYYLQEDGTLSLTPTWYRVGLAISESELILGQMR